MGVPDGKGPRGIERGDWLDLARALEWTPSYVTEAELFPEDVSGAPLSAPDAWAGWDEPYRTSFRDYVVGQHDKELSVRAVCDAVGGAEAYRALDPGWRSAVKLHAATLPLAEFAAVIGNLRAARFGRTAAWRSTALLGALDEARHAQLPLLLMHDLVRTDPGLTWIHRLYHSNNWIGIAARHWSDELLLLSDPIEFAVATNFVFETGFTNLQFVALGTAARSVGDRLFEKMLASIQTDEARHAQIGPATIDALVRHDPARAQRLVDKWFWRSWLLFAVVTGFSLDYFTPVAQRKTSFREFVDEWVIDQFRRLLAEHGLSVPWYWPKFIEAVGTYHHRVYAAAYTYRATTWFDFPLPGPEERAWLREKYPDTWPGIDPMWTQITTRWKKSGPGVEWYTHGTVPIGFCHLCQLVLCNGAMPGNDARMIEHEGVTRVFCSEPCERIFLAEPTRYVNQKDVVQRILSGEAPANLIELVRSYFGLTEDTWGRDVESGDYPWMKVPHPSSTPGSKP